MTKNIFIWNAHPAARSLCGAMADAYQAGAEARGAQVRRMDLAQMSFDADVFQGYPDMEGEAPQDLPPLESDLHAWREASEWAQHIVWVHPYWWGAMPGRAKAMIDRVIEPGWGFRYPGKGKPPIGLLTGRSAELLMTGDTPPIFDWLFYGQSGRRVWKKQIVSVCGLKPVRMSYFGSVHTSNEPQRRKWLATAQQLGARAVR